ncbi:ATP-dependent DNA helicase RecG [Elioraea sp. Yellowstone]|uniref:ATP-dependent DNA helicase RecG n=1 Tax=Elioraea sp. Yellowstone TaxID=2592070 RepID=UPI0011505BFD|nr:ATP-dependent DNA helicase RecG [Elioraea sp. Yellowstone]TQF81477.1 ATP-dependent DNA helicase RecG [Elioraea sp. Yellowstone]
MSRPEILHPLFAALASLPGIGPRREALIARAVGGTRAIDLLRHLPEGVIDRTARPRLDAAMPGRVATLEVTVVRRREPRSDAAPWVITVEDGTGELDILLFGRGGVRAEQLPVGARRLISGELKLDRGRLVMPHPDFILPPERAGELPAIEPVWRLTAGLRPWEMRRAVAAALATLPDLPEWADPALVRRERWPGWAEAVRAVHHPDSEAALAPEHPARARLAYDELLAQQVALALSRRRFRTLRGRALAGDGRLRAAALAAFGHALTPAQATALAEIDADLAAPVRMLRLLQGDVGAGKTIVALLAMLRAVEAGAQAALMAPTDLLARQHHATIARLCEAAGVRAVLLTGREKGRAREAALAALADGSAAIAIGTHALFQEAVAFRDLALAVIDEQHRFGVHQRLLLGAKGGEVDVLVMTATPIPRTLLLTAWGDMDVSRLTGRPPGRRPVVTLAKPAAKIAEVVEAVGRRIAAGARVYWVCPLVSESEETDLAAAEARHADLARHFPGRVGLVHGRMKGPAKDAAMADFAAGRTAILVATTVIEVGVDVPAASVIVIEHAERFGLAQLHQLRGRVGRGTEPSYALLLYDEKLTETARRRIETLSATDDGFAIAEADLDLRGGGEALGTRQSGPPQFRLVELPAHRDLIAMARDDTALLLERDPDLASPRGAAVRLLLHLFEREAVIGTLRAG